MNGANRVVVLRMERTEPAHISEVISQLLPKCVHRPEPAAGKMQVSMTGLVERNRLAENARYPCV